MPKVTVISLFSKYDYTNQHSYTKRSEKTKRDIINNKHTVWRRRKKYKNNKNGNPKWGRVKRGEKISEFWPLPLTTTVNQISIQ